MSEVYIRSQNKEKLYRLGGNYACVEYGEYEDVKKKRGDSMKAWAKSFYLSAAWEKTRAAYLMSQDYICERCGQPAKIVHHKRWLNRENINDICKDGRNHRKGSIYHCGSESRTGRKRWLGTLEEWRRLD